MPVSIKDIAKEAGVSPSTVSRALHDHPRISSETRAYIQDLAKTMGYVPSTIARNLVAKRTATIGVAMADLLDPYYGRLMLGIEDAAEVNNYQVILSSFNRDPERELTIVHDFHKRRVDGIIVTGSEIEEAYSNPGHGFFMPIVLVNRPGYPFSVSVNRALGGQMVVEHLIELGHYRIAHITEGAKYRARSRRLKGYLAALSRHNLPFDSDLITDGDGGISGGIKAVHHFLDLPQPPSAFFCFNDMTAIGVINALRRRGYEIPQDFSVAGFDDLEEIAAYYHPPLTTVRQPTYQIGESAVEMLLKLIEDTDGVVPETVDPALVIRESTAPVTRD